MRIDFLKRFIFSHPRRQLNACLAFLSFFLRRIKPWGMPIRLMIEPANFCNLKCPTCPTGNGSINKTKRLLSLREFQQIIDESGKHLYHLTLWNWGEPFLNKSLPEMIKYARQKGVYVVTSTNGHFFDQATSQAIVDSGLNELIIALDGLSQETLSRYRIGSNYDQIIASVENIARAKKANSSNYPKIELQFILMRHNESDLPKLKEFAKNTGFDRAIIKTFGSHLNWWRLKDFEPTDKRWSRYSQPVKKVFGCKNIWLGMNINSDGNVAPCCYDPFEKYIFGNIFRDGGVKKIWQGENFKNFRQSVLWDKPQVGICRNCDYNQNISQKIDL